MGSSPYALAMIGVLYFILMQPSGTFSMQEKLTWSDPMNGIRIGLAAREDGTGSFLLQLCFANESNTTQRIYFIEQEFFRSFQSYFLGRNTKGDVIPLTSPSPGHGYTVSEKDFPLLHPDSKSCFEQKLLPPRAAAGSLTRLIWVYQNSIGRWEGGVKTFDGLTRQLFDENNFPDLWLGELQVEVPVNG